MSEFVPQAEATIAPTSRLVTDCLTKAHAHALMMARHYLLGTGISRDYALRCAREHGAEAQRIQRALVECGEPAPVDGRDLEAALAKAAWPHPLD